MTADAPPEGRTPEPEAARARLAALSRPALWVVAARVRTLSLSQVPVLAGSWLALEGGQWRPSVMIAAMLSAGAIQVGTNLWNDAADAARGVDRADRLGPPRMVALGLLGGAEVQRMAFFAFVVAVLAGLYLVAVGGWPIVAIGLVSLALGYLYSLGPRPLSGLPLGELLVIGFFGVVAVSGTAWLQGVDPLAPRTLLFGLMVGMPAAAVLMLNNHRDRNQDARAGRRTLAILIGPAASRVAYGAALGVAVILGCTLSPSYWIAVPAVLAAWLCVAMWRLPVSARLNRLLGQTALLQIVLLAAVVAG